MGLLRRASAVCTGLVWWWAASAPLLGAEASPRFVRVVDGAGGIAVDEAIGDLLVVDGEVEIQGVVRGHVYAVDGRVRLRSTAVVLGSIHATGGALHFESGAVLPPELRVAGTEVFGIEGPPLFVGERRLLNGEASSLEVLVAPSTVSVALTKRVLSFDRFSPAADQTVRELRGWHPGMGMDAKRFVENPSKMVIGGLTRLSFVSDKVQGSFQRGYRGTQGSVLFSGVHLKNVASARSLWDQVAAVESPSRVSMSVKSVLGDGAHWFFRRKNRYVLVWQNGPWLIAVETALASRSENQLAQTQFMDQVLRSLRTTLVQAVSQSTGVEL